MGRIGPVRTAGPYAALRAGRAMHAAMRRAGLVRTADPTPLLSGRGRRNRAAGAGGRCRRSANREDRSLRVRNDGTTKRAMRGAGRVLVLHRVVVNVVAVLLVRAL